MYASARVPASPGGFAGTGLSRGSFLVLSGMAVLGVLAVLSSLSGTTAPLPDALSHAGAHAGRDALTAAHAGAQGDRGNGVKAGAEGIAHDDEGVEEEEEEDNLPRARAPVPGEKSGRRRILVRRCPPCPAYSEKAANQGAVAKQQCPACPECAACAECAACEPCPQAPAPVAAPAGPSGDGYAAEFASTNDRTVFSTLKDAVMAQRNPRTNIVTFTQGNAGFHPLTKNWVAMVKKLSPPMNYFVVALDTKELENVKQLPAPVVFEASRAFDPAASEYRQAGYNRMTMNKWGVALDIMKMGVHAFMVDPDIAMLRNPQLYLVSSSCGSDYVENHLFFIVGGLLALQETLPPCDFVTMLEGNPVPTAVSDVIQLGGYFTRASGIPYDNLMNTGYSLFRSTQNMIKTVESFMQYLGEPAQNVQPIEDQTHWANFIHQRYHIRGAPKGSSNDVRGRVVVDAILNGRCIEYVRDGDASDSTAFSFHPLNPFLFMNRPSFDDHKFHERILERPFAVHYNYVIGTNGKVDLMRKNGHFIV